MSRILSQQAFSHAQTLIPGGVNSPVRAFKSVGGEPFVVSHGSGPYLFDLDGNRYVDYICSWGPLVLGHAAPSVVEALSKQAALGTTYGACHRGEAALAEVILGAMPHLEMIRFVNSGTEAAMAGVRLARAATNRSKIIKFSGCYHGHVDALLASAGSGVATLSIPDSKGIPQNVTKDTHVARYNDLKAVEQIISEFPNQVAAVVLEPVVGNAGLITPEPGFLQGLRELTRRDGALLIFDEVMTGFRVHRAGASALFDVVPDLTLLGKVIGGGLPVGAVAGSRELMKLFAPLGSVYQAGTLSGNPLAMAAGIATLQGWLSGTTFDRAAVVAAEVVQTLEEEAGKNNIPLVAQSVGTMFGFFFQAGPVRCYEEAQRSDLARFTKFFWSLLDAGVYFAQSQFEAGFVSVAHEGEALEVTKRAISLAMSNLSK